MELDEEGSENDKVEGVQDWRLSNMRVRTYTPQRLHKTRR